MKIFSKLKQSVSLNKSFFLKIRKYPPAANGAPSPKRFWLYAESLGEFRLALYIIDIIKSILSEQNAPAPAFFISFKTFSTIALVQNPAQKNKDNGGILYFFHPFFGLRAIFKKYVSAVRPDYFISVQHPVSGKLVKELLSSALNVKLIFTGISAAGLKKMNINSNLYPSVPAGRKIADISSLSAVISGFPGPENARIDALPLSLKYISCLKAGWMEKAGETAGSGASIGSGEKHSGKDIVISFASVHKKESFFILNLIKEIISSDSLPMELNLKFIFVPRNIKNSRRLFKASSKIGLQPVYYGESGGAGNLKDFLKSGGAKALIVDKYGVSDNIYQVSDIVYVGKSLFKSEKGGHNILEPALYGKPVITGPYAFGFKDIIDGMVECGALTVATEKNFKGVLVKLIKDGNLRSKTGQNGLNFCLKKRDEFKTYFKNYLTEIIA